MIFEKPDKKSLSRLGIVVAAAILVCVGVFYFFSQVPEIEEKEVVSGKSKKEIIIEQQLQELGQLRGDAQPLTEEEIQEQLEELDQIHQNSQLLTDEEIQKQLEELNKLR